MSNLIKYTDFIDFCREYRGSVKSNRFNLFSKVIGDFNVLLNHKQLAKGDVISLFSNSINGIQVSAKNVLGERIEEAIDLIKANPHSLRLSTFELMEHDFKENTHSNILKYIFDYNLMRNTGSAILENFLINIGSISEKVISKVRDNKYQIQREVSTGDGRIDLLIFDNTNKFVIVIENKLLSTVSKYEIIAEDEAIIKTQLDKYENYINSFYSDYDKVFILLSFINQQVDYYPFISADYENIYTVLTIVDSDDQIIDEYRLLLHSLINNIIDKESLIKSAKALNTNAIISLNRIEEINKLFKL